MVKIQRIRILFILLAAVVLYRGFQVYDVFFGTGITPGFNWDVQDGYLSVESIRERTPEGAPNPVFQAGLRRNDRIKSVYNSHGKGWQIKNLGDFCSVIRTIRQNEKWTIHIIRTLSNGTRQELRLEVPQMPVAAIDFRARFLRFTLNLLVPLLGLFTGFFIGFMKPEDDHAFLASLLFVSFSSLYQLNIFAFPAGIREFADSLHRTLNVFSLYLFLRFFLLFPSPSLIERMSPWVKVFALVYSLAIWPLEMISVYSLYTSFGAYQEVINFLNKFQWIFITGSFAMLVLGLASLVLNTIRAETQDEKRKMAILLLGTTICFLPMTLLYVYVHAFNAVKVPIWMFIIVTITTSVFPISFIYVVLKHRVLGIRLILRRGIKYFLISRGIILIQALLGFITLHFILSRFLPELYRSLGSPLFSLAIAVLVAALLWFINRLNHRIMPAIDRRFFREAYNAQLVLTDLSRAIRWLAAQPTKLLELIAEKISNSLFVDQVAIFVRKSELLPTSINGKMDLNGTTTDNFVCCHVYRRSHSEPEAASVTNDSEALLLPSESLISQQMENVAEAEPETIEVYLDDTGSWASVLARVRPGEENLYQERLMIQELNTRLIVPMVISNRILGFFSLGEKLSEEPYSREDKDLLLAVAQQAAVALDYSKLIQQVAEQEKLKREIEIAKQVQAQLFPQSIPPIENLDYVGICKAARGVGGDYYDFLQLGPDQLGIALGDISGKGISAALLMASLQALLRSHALRHKDSVDALVTDINRLMCTSTARSKYATFFYGFYDSKTLIVDYLNAGHLPPILIRNDGGILRLPPGGMVIGMFPNAKYRKERVQLREDDLLFIFSDGVSEALNAKEEEFGEDRLITLLIENKNLSASVLRDLIVSSVAEFVGEAPQDDDLTFVIVKVHAGGGEPRFTDFGEWTSDKKQPGGSIRPYSLGFFSWLRTNPAKKTKDQD